MDISVKARRRLPRSLFLTIVIDSVLLISSLILLAFKNEYATFVSELLFSFSVNLAFLVGLSRTKSINKLIKIVSFVLGIVLVSAYLVFYEEFVFSSMSSGESIISILCNSFLALLPVTTIATIVSLLFARLIKAKNKGMVRLTYIVPGVIISVVTGIVLLINSGILEGLLTAIMAPPIFIMIGKYIAESKEEERAEQAKWEIVDKNGHRYTYTGYDNVYSDGNGNRIAYDPGSGFASKL